MLSSKFKAEGFVLIRDADTGEVLVDEHNAIHDENMSVCIAEAFIHRDYGYIDRLYFGNGGSVIAGTGVVTYFPPNVSDTSATLYNPTYSKIVDDNSTANLDPARNYMEILHTAGQDYTDIVVHCYLDYNEPSGQEVFDSATNTEGLYIFDEIGLFSYPQTGQNAKLLTHCIFNPIQKSLNRAIEIVYTVRILVSQ